MEPTKLATVVLDGLAQEYDKYPSFARLTENDNLSATDADVILTALANTYERVMFKEGSDREDVLNALLKVFRWQRNNVLPTLPPF